MQRFCTEEDILGLHNPGPSLIENIRLTTDWAPDQGEFAALLSEVFCIGNTVLIKTPKAEQ